MAEVMLKSAVISKCGVFRYQLERVWEAEVDTRRLLWVMINPSTADAVKPDPTITRCIGFAKRLGFGQMAVVNLYAFRSSKVSLLREEIARAPYVGWEAHRYAAGPENDAWIRKEAASADLIIGAWGPKPWCLSQAEHVVGGLLRPYDIHCLHVCGNGAPGHPLMLPRDAALRLWKPAR